MRYLLILLVVLSTALTTACSSAISNLKPFKLEIQQGNVVTSKMLLQLRPGMTKSQVRYIMGTPLIVDSFHNNRWDYIFQLRQSGKITEQKRVILQFENELLKTVRGDVMPAGADAGAGVVRLTPAAEKTAPKARNAKDDNGESFTDKLEFWKSKNAPAADKPADVEKKVEPAVVIPVVPTTSVPDVVAPAAATAIDANDVTAPVVSEPALEVPVVVDQATPAANTPSIKPQVEQIPAPTSQPALSEPAVVVPKTEIKPAPSDVKPPESAPMPIPETKTNAGALSDYELKFDSALESKHPSKAVDSSSTKPDQPAEPDESPGYFERILEKIGF